SDLHAFKDGAFDLVVTSIVLQHVEPEIALLYLPEFFRVLSPAGIVVFQLPSHERRRTERAALSIVHPVPDAAYWALPLRSLLPPRSHCRWRSPPSARSPGPSANSASWLSAIMASTAPATGC